MLVRVQKSEVGITYTYQISAIKTVDVIFQWVEHLLKKNIDFSGNIFVLDNTKTIEQGDIAKKFALIDNLEEVKRYCLENHQDRILIDGKYGKQILSFMINLRDLTIQVNLLKEELEDIREIERISGLTFLD